MAVIDSCVWYQRLTGGGGIGGSCPPGGGNIFFLQLFTGGGIRYS